MRPCLPVAARARTRVTNRKREEVSDEPAPSKPLEIVTRRFERFGFPLVLDDHLIPDDDTTLFVCSGMQRVRERFRRPDGTRHGSLQSCLRTNDLELVGDGSHLTFFQMVGNFSFGGDEYATSVELWHSIVSDLALPVDRVTVHPDRTDHRALWEKLGYRVVLEPECVWSDGAIGGHCCELFVGELEIGNLVNPLGHSTDVGFGWERLHQVYERTSRVDGTSLFETHEDPVVVDHVRALEALRRNGVAPGNKGRGSVARRLLRRLLPRLRGDERVSFGDWLESERKLREERLREARRALRRNRDKPPEWWWESVGIVPEELAALRDERRRR